MLSAECWYSKEPLRRRPDDGEDDI